MTWTQEKRLMSVKNKREILKRVDLHIRFHTANGFQADKLKMHLTTKCKYTWLKSCQDAIQMLGTQTDQV